MITDFCYIKMHNLNVSLQSKFVYTLVTTNMAFAIKFFAIMDLFHVYGDFNHVATCKIAFGTFVNAFWMHSFNLLLQSIFLFILINTIMTFMESSLL